MKTLEVLIAEVNKLALECGYEEAVTIVEKAQSRKIKFALWEYFAEYCDGM